jgi:predicted RNA-binding Zn ribbon-like protein
MTMTRPTYAAPGELETLRRFINTGSPEEGLDFTIYYGLQEWCAKTGLCTDASPQDLSRLRAFREGLREVLDANGGAGEASSAWAALEPFVQAASYGMRIDVSGSPALEPAGHGAERTIAALLAIVYDAMRRGYWPRLKACRKESCRWAYYDHSKNGSGVWCDMAVCGNRMKAKRRRNRAKNPA